MAKRKSNKASKDSKLSEKARAFVNYYGNPIDDEAGANNSADWSAVDPTLLVSAINGATSEGGAIMLGSDRSGFLYSVTVYLGGERVSKYFHPEREFELLESYLVALHELGQQ